MLVKKKQEVIFLAKSNFYEKLHQSSYNFSIVVFNYSREDPISSHLRNSNYAKYRANLFDYFWYIAFRKCNCTGSCVQCESNNIA